MLDFALRNYGTSVHHAPSLKGEYLARTDLVRPNFRQDFASSLKNFLFQDFHQFSFLNRPCRKVRIIPAASLSKGVKRVARVPQL